MQFIGEHLVLILSILLGLSEVLGLLFPGAGGVIAAVVSVLKALGAKDPIEPPKV